MLKVKISLLCNSEWWFHEEDETKYNKKKETEDNGERFNCHIEREHPASKGCIK